MISKKKIAIIRKANYEMTRIESKINGALFYMSKDNNMKTMYDELRNIKQKIVSMRLEHVEYINKLCGINHDSV